MAQSQVAQSARILPRVVRPEGTRPHLGALLLGWYTDDGELIYAGRVGTGMSVKVLADLRSRLDPLPARRRL
jgi:ATP-dependent DNA ligase